jgi:hypothetical protein
MDRRRREQRALVTLHGGRVDGWWEAVLLHKDPLRRRR